MLIFHEELFSKRKPPLLGANLDLDAQEIVAHRNKNGPIFIPQKVVSLRLAFVCFSILVVLQIDRAFSHLINSKQKRCC